jgi:hypothetical protein
VVDCLFGLIDTMYHILGAFFTPCNKTTLSLSFERRRDSRAVYALLKRSTTHSAPSHNSNSMSMGHAVAIEPGQKNRSRGTSAGRDSSSRTIRYDTIRDTMRYDTI